MSLDGYVEYQRRAFCKDVRCRHQIDLEAQSEGSAEYEKIRQICKDHCVHTTYQFHHWLITKGYVIARLKDRG